MILHHPDPSTRAARLDRIVAAVPASGLALAVFGAVLIASIWVTITQRVRTETAEALNSEITKNANLALAVDAQANQMLKGIDQFLVLIKSQHEGPGPRVPLAQLVGPAFAGENAVTLIGVIDAQGEVVEAVTAYTAANAADRAMFKMHRAADSGAMLVSAVEHKERPSVGLLNIGEEDIKGNEVVKQAGELLRESGLNFYGNIEGDDIYKGTTDVVVCDGFVGNVLLKTSEGLVRMLATFLREEFSRNAFTKLAALLAMPALNAFKRRVDPRRYNGASLLGLRGIVVKSHGSADKMAFIKALEHAAEAARNRLVERISERMAQHVIEQIPLQA